MRSSLEYRYVSNQFKLPTVEENSDSILLSDTIHYSEFHDYAGQLAETPASFAAAMLIITP